MTEVPILVVDDNVLNLKLTRLLLEGHGFRVRTAGSGQEALAILEDFQPRLILMDLQLPDLDGFELTRVVKSNASTRHIPVVALTAYAMKGDEDRALEAGCDGYIAKPIDTRTLVARLAGYLAAARQRMELPS